MITAKINGIPVEVPQGTTILQAAHDVQVKIPILCKHPDLEATAACGICIVKVGSRGAGSSKMLRACCTPLEAGMEVTTHDAEIVSVRRTVIELILSKHPNSCLTCGRNQNCELQRLAADFGIRSDVFPNLAGDPELDSSTGTLTLDPSKCITCGRCVQVCQEVQNVHALCFLERGIGTRIAAAGVSLGESPCVRCGQCSAHCPTGAIVEYDETAKVWGYLQDPSIFTAVQIAPSVRVAIGEAFGFAPGVNLTGKLYAALRRMGFDAVFDTNFGADVTIMEEGSEFLERFTRGHGELPLITSCCPAWVDYLEKFHADMIEHFSTCKSPHAIVGTLTKTYFAEARGLDPSRLRVVSIMPCTAKKWEILRSDEMSASGHQDVDVSLTTRELSRMIKQAGIELGALKDEGCDSVLGTYTGAGTIFGVTGGVMEAALRTAAHLMNTQLGSVELEQVRGLQGVKEASVQLGDHVVRVGIAHGLSNVDAVLKRVREAKEAGDEPPYHFIEVMACPGGCVGGGGQPYGITDAVRRARGDGLYAEDAAMKTRRSDENPDVRRLYRDYLGEPLGRRSHELLHTRYQARMTYTR